MCRQVFSCILGAFVLFGSFSSHAEIDVESRIVEKEKLQDFDHWLDDLKDKGEVSGTFLFARKGKVVYARSIGRIHPVKSGSIEANSSFNLGSVSKPFTSMAVMLLEHQGKLGFDHKVQQYLPMFPYPNVTIRHLLTHTSGMIDYEELSDLYWHQRSFTNQDMLSLFSKYTPSLSFLPGAKFEYSNTGYVVLAALVEAISKQSLEEFSKVNIFTPLGMNNTRVFTVMSPEQRFQNRVFGQHGRDLFDLYHIEGVTGDGAVYSTALDLLGWHNAILNRKLLSDAALLDAFKPVKLLDGARFNYGFGWMVSDKHPGMATHDGSWLGFRSFLSRNESRDEFMVFLTNNTAGVKFSDIRSRFLQSVDAELIYAKGDFIVCQSSAFSIHCDPD